MTRAKVHGAALLAAMITLVLVATLAASTTWQQWRGVEVERAERSRLQAAWILIGALDWARLILREDARNGGADHLGEPWAVPLKESQLSSFLAADKDNNALLSDLGDINIFLSGQIQDAQARLNVFNLIEAGGISATSLASFTKLFDLLNLDEQELIYMTENLRIAATGSAADSEKTAGESIPILPHRLRQLTLLGLSRASLERLEPFIVWLPVRTPVNLNTASTEVLYASVPGLDLAGAQKLVSQRSKEHFKSLADLKPILAESPALVSDKEHSVSTRYFEVTGRLRMVDGPSSSIVTEHSLVQREGRDVRALWRERVNPSMPFDGLRGDALAQFDAQSVR